MNFTDKKVLITGGSRGIGYATAHAFLALGARATINGRTEQSVAAAITRLAGGDRLVAAVGNVGAVAGCESSGSIINLASVAGLQGYGRCR